MATKWCTKLEVALKRCPIVFQGHPSHFKVTRDKTSPILTQIGRFRTIGRSQLSNPSDLPCLGSSIKFQGHAGWKIDDLNPIWVRLLGRSQLSNPSDLPCLAATKQLYDWFSPSVCSSVCLSVTPFSPCSHHRIIMKFSGVITMVRSDVRAKGQRSRSQRSTPNLAVSVSNSSLNSHMAMKSCTQLKAA